MTQQEFYEHFEGAINREYLAYVDVDSDLDKATSVDDIKQLVNDIERWSEELKDMAEALERRIDDLDDDLIIED